MPQCAPGCAIGQPCDQNGDHTYPGTCDANTSNPPGYSNGVYIPPPASTPPASTPPASGGGGNYGFNQHVSIPGSAPPPPSTQTPSNCKGPGQYDTSQGQQITCCPGLTTDHNDQSDNNYHAVSCNPPPCSSQGQVPAQYGSCCSPLTLRNGSCQPPPGMAVGNFVSGPLPVTTGTGSCSGSPGWVVGKQRDCGDDGLGHHHWAAYYVDSSRPKTSLCPAIGTLASAKWVDDGNKTGFTTGEGGIGSRIRLQCVYSTITNPFDQRVLNTFTGTGATSIDALGGPQNQACDSLPYSQLVTNSNCQGFYNTKTQNYDYQLVFRINEENPNGEWATNPQLLQIVQQVAMGIQASGVTSTSSQGQSLAQSMITNYCIVQKPSDWVGNDTLRALINNWVLNPTGNPQFNSIQQSAQDIVTHYCSSVSPTSPHCDCYNAVQFGTNIFNACQGNTTTTCSDINRLAASLAQAPAIFAPQIATLKSYITPKCAVGQCVSAATGGNTTYLAPTVLAEITCQSDINLCLESVKIGGSLQPGATINQNCTQTIGLPGNVPQQPTPTTPTTPPTNQGFQNAQAVQVNASSPTGGTTAVVNSQAGGSTNVQTTSSPTGTLQQQVTASAPVTTASTGGPVSVTFSPAPIPVSSPVSSPSPVASPAPVALSQQQYEIAAGGGFIGLSSSFLSFACVCIIILVLMSRRSGPAAAPRPIVLPGGF